VEYRDRSHAEALKAIYNIVRGNLARLQCSAGSLTGFTLDCRSISRSLDTERSPVRSLQHCIIILWHRPHTITSRRAIRELAEHNIVQPQENTCGQYPLNYVCRLLACTNPVLMHIWFFLVSDKNSTHDKKRKRKDNDGIDIPAVTEAWKLEKRKTDRVECRVECSPGTRSLVCQSGNLKMSSDLV
jgi:hypothetical protein